MGLIATLGLKPRRAGNPARRGAVSLARTAARLKKGEARNVLEAAIDAAIDPDSNTPSELDGLYIEDPSAKDFKAVSEMAPREAYKDIPISQAEPGVKGHIALTRTVSVQPGEDNRGTQIAAVSEVKSRGIVADAAGNGEAMYARPDPHRQGMRELVTFKVPEPLTMKHEHLHLVIAAHVNARIEQFASKAFAEAPLEAEERADLAVVLKSIGDKVQDEVSDWLDDHTIPRTSLEIKSRLAMVDRLLKDVTIEVRVRTSLLNQVRKHAKELGTFRK